MMAWCRDALWCSDARWWFWWWWWWCFPHLLSQHWWHVSSQCLYHFLLWRNVFDDHHHTVHQTPIIQQRLYRVIDGLRFGADCSVIADADDREIVFWTTDGLFCVVDFCYVFQKLFVETGPVMNHDQRWWMLSDKQGVMSKMMSDEWWVKSDEWWMRDEWWVSDEWKEYMTSVEYWVSDDEWWMHDEWWWYMWARWWAMSNTWWVTHDERWTMSVEYSVSVRLSNHDRQDVAVMTSRPWLIWLMKTHLALYALDLECNERDCDELCLIIDPLLLGVAGPFDDGMLSTATMLLSDPADAIKLLMSLLLPLVVSSSRANALRSAILWSDGDLDKPPSWAMRSWSCCVP